MMMMMMMMMMMNCFCGIVDQQKAFRLIYSRDHCQRSLKEIWPNIVAVIKYLEYLAKSHIPSCKSFEAVVVGVKVGLVTAKLSFYSFIGNFLQP